MMQGFDDCTKEPYEMVYEFLEKFNKKMGEHGIGEFGE